jgi:hypothetical protein
MAIGDGLIEEIRLSQRYSHHIKCAPSTTDDAKDETTPEIKKKTLFTEDLLKRMAQDSILGNEVMPVNCRYLEKTPHGYMLIIEEPPAMRTISISKNFEREWNDLQTRGIIEQTEYHNKFGKYSSRQTQSFTLALPYVIFMFYIDNSYGMLQGRAFVRPAQMSGTSDFVCKMPMLNISDSQTICFGDQGHIRQRSLSAAVSNLIMVFWSATFNPDYTYNYSAYRDVPILGNYLEWAHMSKVDPMFVYTADWIKYATIAEQLRIMRGIMEDRQGRERGMSFKDLERLFYEPQDTGKEAKVKATGRKKHKLFYDICQGIYLNNDIYLNVGDTIQLKNGEFAYVDTFIGFMDGGEVKYIGLDYKGKQLVLKYHGSAERFLRKNIEDQRMLSKVELKNGSVIKPNDIIVINRNGKEEYKKVKYIRRSRGDNPDLHEVRIGNSYYFSNILDAKPFDVEKPEISGVEIEKDVLYIVSTDVNESAMNHGGIYKFHSLDVEERSDNIVVKFKCQDKYIKSDYKTVRLGTNTLRSTRQKIIKASDAKPMPKIFRVGRNLKCGMWNDDPVENAAMAYNGRVFIQGNYRWSSPHISNLKDLVVDNKFHVVGVDGDITFEIGDKVVHADWKNPLDVLNVKTICGFKVDEGNGKISFILTDKSEKLSEVVYVDLQRSGAIYVGKVRKVTNKFEKLSVGTKIIAKEAGIYCFPKKDVNIVVAIIIDGPFEPLVLCSNGCTLWYSDVIEKFKKVTMKSKKWATLQHVPLDLSKIKFQAGDIIVGQRNYTSSLGFLLSGEITRQLRATPLEVYSGYPDSYSFDRYFQADSIFDCIPAPRLGPKNQGELGYKYGFPDFHGNCLIAEDQTSKYLLINDRGL